MGFESMPTQGKDVVRINELKKEIQTIKDMLAGPHVEVKDASGETMTDEKWQEEIRHKEAELAELEK